MRHAIDHVEVFPAPGHVTEVRFTTEELTSVCPITGQPDISSVEIVYTPGEWCVESKSLKLYLWGFRDRPVFAEALAAEIAGEIFDTAQAIVGHRHAHPAPARRHHDQRHGRTATDHNKCERVSASERAVTNGLRGRGTQFTSTAGP